MDPFAETGNAPASGDVAFAPGSLAAQWDRVLSTPRGTRRARMTLSVALVLVLVLVSAAAWQSFVHSSLAARLRGMNEIVFVGGQNFSFISGNDPSGTVAVTTSGPVLPQIFVTQPDGSGLHQLTHLAHGFYFSPVWSPDGTRIAAFSVANIDNLMAHLVVMDADGSDVHVIPSVAFSLDTFSQVSDVTGDLSIAWSPNGSQLVVLLGSQQYVLMNADGTHARVVNGFLPTWSPDGRYLAFYVNAPIDQNSSDSGAGEYTIALLDTQTFKTQVLRTLPGLNAEALAWSPDGRYLAVTAAWGDSFQTVPTDSILLIHPDGTGLKVVDQWTNAQIEQVAWSPDAQKLAVVLQDFTAIQVDNGQQNNGVTLAEVNADGSHFHRIGFSDGGPPSWAPDGKHLVYANPDDTTLLVADAISQPTPAPRPLTASLDLLFAPNWSPLAGL